MKTFSKQTLDWPLEQTERRVGDQHVVAKKFWGTEGSRLSLRNSLFKGLAGGGHAHTGEATERARNVEDSQDSGTGEELCFKTSPWHSRVLWSPGRSEPVVCPGFGKIVALRLCVTTASLEGGARAQLSQAEEQVRGEETEVRCQVPRGRHWDRNSSARDLLKCSKNIPIRGGWMNVWRKERT